MGDTQPDKLFTSAEIMIYGQEAYIDVNKILNILIKLRREYPKYRFWILQLNTEEE